MSDARDLRPWCSTGGQRIVKDMQTDRLGMTVLSSGECYDLLRSAQVGRLAIAIGTHPEIFPVNFVVDGSSIVFRTAEGTKLAASVLSPAVAFEADGVIAASDEAWSVVVKGRAREVERVDALLDGLDLLLYPWQAAPKHRFVRISADEVSGRRFSVVDPSLRRARAGIA